VEFTISPEMENSHWLKGEKEVITLTIAAVVITDMSCDS